MHRISDMSEHLDPLAYVILFPSGDPGWTPALQHKQLPGELLSVSDQQRYTRVSPEQFYRRRLMVFSGGEGDPDTPATLRNRILPHAGGLLFQQYCCDAYTRKEAQALRWYRTNQDSLRAESYKGLVDAMSLPEFEAGVTKVGRQVILPATYAGGPRAMQQNYLDSMSIVKKFGKPDFFITMTASPTWPEIKKNLRKGETAATRPDLVARVFHLKLRALLDDLLKKQVLGKPLAYTWVVEFQKRGLPHLHLLLIVHPEDKPRTPEDIDRIISAELPDPDDPEQSELLGLVLGCMIHGPCGARNSRAPCCEEGSCTKGFPKAFAETTILQESGYPVYRRSEESARCVKGDHPVDARDVVPYNPYLSKRFKCHINVEYCGSIKAVKYLYKYTYKGHDRAQADPRPASIGSGGVHSRESLESEEGFSPGFGGGLPLHLGGGCPLGFFHLRPLTSYFILFFVSMRVLLLSGQGIPDE